MWIKTILVKQHRTFGSGQWLQQIASCSHYHSYKLPTSSRQFAQKALACTQLLLPLLNLRLTCASKGCMPAPCQWPLAWWPLDHNTGPRKVYTVPRGLFLPFFSNIIKFLIVFMQACIICGSCSNQDAQVIDSQQNQTWTLKQVIVAVSARLKNKRKPTSTKTVSTAMLPTAAPPQADLD